MQRKHYNLSDATGELAQYTSESYHCEQNEDNFNVTEDRQHTGAFQPVLPPPPPPLDGLPPLLQETIHVQNYSGEVRGERIESELY